MVLHFPGGLAKFDSHGCLPGEAVLRFMAVFATPFTIAGVPCDTGTSGQHQSNGNIELVRFLDSHEGDGARALFTGVQLLYMNNFPNDPPSKFAHR